MLPTFEFEILFMNNMPQRKIAILFLMSSNISICAAEKAPIGDAKPVIQCYFFV